MRKVHTSDLLKHCTIISSLRFLSSYSISLNSSNALCMEYYIRTVVQIIMHCNWIVYILILGHEQFIP